MLVAEPPPLEVHEALSGIFGSISLACWVFLLVPQLYENYISRSASGLSLAFLTVWFLGDVTNFLGATWARLVPTAIALAVYFIIADASLITQVLYYNWTNRARAGSAGDGGAGPSAHGEEEPLIRRSGTDVPGSRRRSSAASRRRESALTPSDLRTIEEDGKGGAGRTVVKNIVAVLAICAVGTAGWAVAHRVGLWKPTPTSSDAADGSRPVVAEGRLLAAKVLGYMSAVCYLGARIPQILKNHRDRSCDGLSLLFFILSLLGNATYGAQILLHSLDRQYILTNLPWLIGSLGTIGEDTLIFVQFHMYRKKGMDASAIE